MPEVATIKGLLDQVGSKVSHSKELAKLKGEKFNIFSLLNMETSENITHSRLLAELLDRKGTHGLNENLIVKFVQFLLQWIKDEKNIILTDFDYKSSRVEVEKTLGKRDDINKTGGRIDIAITDKNGYSILIENKIYAADQNAQIQRYCNFDKPKCIVLYLTLYGNIPSDLSRGLLKNGKDFYCISYKKEIIEWLESCVKEAADAPILRETIKQYVTLIKKLTGQLTNHKMDREVKNIILENLESAEIIAKNFVAAKEDLLNKIRIGVKKSLEQNEEVSNKYRIKEHGKISDRNSKIWFYHKEVEDSLGIYFGIEPFSGNGNSRNELFIGFIDINARQEQHFLNDESNLPIIGWWRGVEYLTFKGSRIKLSDLKLLKEISRDENLNYLIEEVAQQTRDYLQRHEHTLLRICDKAAEAVE